MKRVIGVLIVMAAAPLFAWGPVGHRVVAAVAESQLTPNARAKARALNGGAPLQDLALWADDIRNSRPKTKPWHFVDIPIDEAGYDASRDCDDDDCVVARIDEFAAVLADASKPKKQRREALKFLVHFIGDIHQPLHASDNDDGGGNDTFVKFGGQDRKLHGVWDSGIMNLIGTEASIRNDVKQMIASGDGNDHDGGTAEDWANESHEVGKAAYAQILNDLKLSGPEVTHDEEVIKEQLVRASVRLAKALNDALD